MLALHTPYLCRPIGAFQLLTTHARLLIDGICLALHVRCDKRAWVDAITHVLNTRCVCVALKESCKIAPDSPCRSSCISVVEQAARHCPWDCFVESVNACCIVDGVPLLTNLALPG